MLKEFFVRELKKEPRGSMDIISAFSGVGGYSD